jgi:hypothetical protein
MLFVRKLSVVGAMIGGMYGLFMSTKGNRDISSVVGVLIKTCIFVVSCAGIGCVAFPLAVVTLPVSVPVYFLLD